MGSCACAWAWNERQKKNIAIVSKDIEDHFDGFVEACDVVLVVRMLVLV
jgi:hypothetical protein